MFPNRKGMVKKLLYFPFTSSVEKCFQLFCTEMWWETFSLYRFWAYTEVKDSTLFSIVLRALARKLHPCYLLFHLLSSCRAVTLPCSKAVSILGWRVSSQEFEQGGIGEWQKEENMIFSSVLWNPESLEDQLQSFCLFLSNVVSAQALSPRS